MQFARLKRREVATLLGGAAAAAVQPVSAQNWPNRTVRIVVPYAPGGGVSLLAQTLGTRMQELMKQWSRLPRKSPAP